MSIQSLTHTEQMKKVAGHLTSPVILDLGWEAKLNVVVVS